MKKVRIAIIGCGSIANSAHIPAYMKNPKAEIVCFCDIIRERAEKAVKQYGIGRAVTDYHELLNDPEIDAVSVCTPNKVHSTISIDFMRAGKDVLCEKPAARIYSEALKMQKGRRETGRLLNIGVCNRFNTSVNRIKNLIDAGDNFYAEFIKELVGFFRDGRIRVPHQETLAVMTVLEYGKQAQKNPGEWNFLPAAREGK